MEEPAEGPGERLDRRQWVDHESNRAELINGRGQEVVAVVEEVGEGTRPIRAACGTNTRQPAHCPSFCSSLFFSSSRLGAKLGTRTPARWGWKSCVTRHREYELCNKCPAARAPFAHLRALPTLGASNSRCPPCCHDHPQYSCFLQQGRIICLPEYLLPPIFVSRVWRASCNS